jgi:DNA-binding IclR family transcriptional regulator
MNRNEFGARQQPYTFHGVQHREIGLRAVAAAILYQSGNVERTISCELSVPPAAATPSGDHEP